MKIGILTYHRTLNYGACLQAIATRVTLEKMGHEVYYVDYWPDYHANKYKLFSFKRFFSLDTRARIKYLMETIKNRKSILKRIRKFDIFFKRYIYPYCKPVEEKYDIIVYGSDQIWRKQQRPIGYNPVYFGKNSFQASKHIAYSASMGLMPKTEQDIKRIKEYLSNLDEIAVREQNLQDLLFSMGYADTTLTLDPTLLLTAEEWNDIVPQENVYKEKFVLVYGINSIAFNLNEIKKFALTRGLRIKMLFGNSAETPIEFVSLIRHAEFVFTSSFHGLAFSVIYNKQFYVSYGSNSNRAETLLNSLQIKNRLIKPNSTIPQESEPIDYYLVNKNLYTSKMKSFAYLEKVLIL